MWCCYEAMQLCKVAIAVIQFLYYNARNAAMDNKGSHLPYKGIVEHWGVLARDL